MLITTKVKEINWKEFLEQCDEALVYHTPEWRTFLESTFSYDPHYLFAVDESDKILGMLPLMYVESRIFPTRLYCLPFAHICGYIGNEKLKNNLLREAVEIYKNLHPKYLEIKDYVEEENFKALSRFSTYVLELSSNLEEVWKKLDKGSVRWAIKKAPKMGVNVKVMQNMNDLVEFYEMNCITKRRIGVPCHPLRFFEGLFEYLGDFIKLYVAKYKDEAIGGGIMIFYKNKVIYGYGAANPENLKLHPYNAFLWKGIEDACLNGFRYFDFGRVSYDNVGLASFKRRWGTTKEKLYYSYYPENQESFMGNRGLIYQLGTKVIQRMPMPGYKKLSDLIFKNLG